MGDTVAARSRACACERRRPHARAARGSILLRDGRPLAESTAPSTQAPGPGCLSRRGARAGLGRALGAHEPDLRLRRATQRGARGARGLAHARSRAPAAARVLDDFEGRTAFAPEFDPVVAMSTCRFSIPRRGARRRGAAKLAFRLARPAPAGPTPGARSSTARRATWAGGRGLVFSFEADGDYRLWVQVRDRTRPRPTRAPSGGSPRSAPRTSGAASPCPFARLRSLNPRTDGRLDLDKVKALVFVLDQGAVKPGTPGRSGSTTWALY